MRSTTHPRRVGRWRLWLTLAAAPGLILAGGCADPASEDEQGVMVESPRADATAPAEFEVDARKQQLIGVTYGVVERREVRQTIRTVGTIALNESLLADVTLKFHGWIEDLRVDRTGDLVQKGEVLFSLYSPELVQTQQDYLTAYDHLRRIESSGRSGDAVTRVRDLLAAGEQRLAYWDIEPSHLERLGREREVLRAIPIHSPAAGYVIEKNVVEGGHVQAGQLLYRIAGLDTVWVLADIYEHELLFVEPGLPVSVTLAYLPGETLVGTVDYVYPTLESSERTVKVRIELPNPGHRLREGMYADVVLDTPQREVLVVPSEAVLDSGERKVVFVARGEGFFEPREVRLGARFEDVVEILGGVEEGETLVTSANFLLDSESQLAAGMRQMAH